MLLLVWAVVSESMLFPTFLREKSVINKTRHPKNVERETFEHSLKCTTEAPGTPEVEDFARQLEKKIFSTNCARIGRCPGLIL